MTSPLEAFLQEPQQLLAKEQAEELARGEARIRHLMLTEPDLGLTEAKVVALMNVARQILAEQFARSERNTQMAMRDMLLANDIIDIH
ncbi:hypothetical protein [Piscinibacter koreensis]|uniref:Uncharacterized protein n=1 Tax=Piscinibacter koreensis TaxID=2742824 RepID=A0A7Y6NQZ4_9BURK|nr:hypothetical protein [Schlegelella koreensis]NUZ07612.1 hypothetical protein [Schlegelella koreensis]